VSRERLLAPSAVLSGASADGGGSSGEGSDDADGEVAQLLQFCEIASRWAITRALSACSSPSPSKIEVALVLRTRLGASNEACVALAEILTQPSAHSH
jgi:hypothetical protein